MPPLLGFEIVEEGQVLTDKREDERLEIVAALLRQYHDWHYFQDRHFDDLYKHLPHLSQMQSRLEAIEREITSRGS